MSGLKDMFHVLDQFVILSRYAVSEEAAACRTIGHPSDRQAAAASLSADLGKITNWGPTRGTCSIRTNLTLSLCLSERTAQKKTPYSFSTILWKRSFHSSFWVSLSAMIFPEKATFPTRPPKPVTDWESSIKQRPSSAHLSS